MYLEHFVGVRVKLSKAKEACLFILGTQNWSWRYTGITGYHRHCVRQGPHTAACTVLLLIVVGWCRGQRGLPRSWILNQHLSLMTPEPGAGDCILDLSMSTWHNKWTAPSLCIYENTRICQKLNFNAVPCSCSIGLVHSPFFTFWL